jgi:circadian clock protein KaiC
MTKQKSLEKIKTGVLNLDEILQGGLPKGSITVLAGTPGSGKTILSQQISFFNATAESPVIFFQTLSEPTVKTLGYLSQFDFFDKEKLGKSVHFIDLGDILRSNGIEQAVSLFVAHIKKIRPAIVVIDSFKVFDDLAHSREEYRKFSYEIALHLMAWECTALLLGEFGKNEIESNPLFSVVDGILVMFQRKDSDEQRRYIQALKMRGTKHSRDEHSLNISDHGIDIYAPRVVIQSLLHSDKIKKENSRVQTGIKALDQLIHEGIPRGSSCLVSGASGTGKSLLSLEFLYRGATEYNEKGILFLFEETQDRILASTSKMGWDFSAQIKRGMIEVISISQPEILVEQHLLMIHDAVQRFGAKRVVIDSTSVFLYKIREEQIIREKIYQLSTIIQNARAVGFFVTDTPPGTAQLSRFNVEETVVDGVILLSSKKIDLSLKRERYLEVYKLRNTHHLNHSLKIVIGKTGIVQKQDTP